MAIANSVPKPSDALNDAWGTVFWGQRYREWDEIDAPRLPATTSNQTQRLDFKRLTSDALLECCIAGRHVIRRYCPDKPITTNFMATHCLTPDYWRWAQEVDIVANDHYLAVERTNNHMLLTMDADFTRSLARSRPLNWQSRNIAKHPGELARNSFFPISPAARGSRVAADVAIVWDTESFWGQDLEWRPSAELDHRERIEAFYTALWTQGVTVDFVHPSHDLSPYRRVVVPSLYLISPESAANRRQYVANGGALLVLYFSGIVDQNDTVYSGAASARTR